MIVVVDSNVLIDLFNSDPTWARWSRAQIERIALDGDELVASIVTVAEIAGNFAQFADLEAMLDRLDIEIAPLSGEIAFVAGQAFREYRRRHRERDAILTDLFIGALAAATSGTLLTRDDALYRRYFPDLDLITPETHP